jgi:hypothetical protein
LRVSSIEEEKFQLYTFWYNFLLAKFSHFPEQFRKSVLELLYTYKPRTPLIFFKTSKSLYPILQFLLRGRGRPHLQRGGTLQSRLVRALHLLLRGQGVAFTFKGAAVFSCAGFGPLHLLLRDQESPSPQGGGGLQPHLVWGPDTFSYTAQGRHPGSSGKCDTL